MTVNFTETERRTMVARGRGQGRELVFSGNRISVWEDEHVLAMDGDDGRAILGML